MPVAVSLILNGILWATILLDKHLWHISKHLELLLDHSHLDNEVFVHAISQHAYFTSGITKRDSLHLSYYDPLFWLSSLWKETKDFNNLTDFC